MPDIAPVVQEPTKIPAPTEAGSQGAADLVETPKAPVDDPFEFELDVKGQKQKLKFQTKDQLKAVLQKALYADQVIKDASQAKKGAEALMQKIKTPQGLREILRDPEINMDVKQFALDTVKEMMNREEKYKDWTPEQMKAAERAELADKYEAEMKAKEEEEKARIAQEKSAAQAQEIRGQIIESMKKYPDIPQTQATMDAVIQNMRAAYRRFGKHLTAEQAMAVYSQQYWTSLGSVLDKMSPEQIMERFGKKTLDKIQQLKLNELKNKTNPAMKAPSLDGEVKKKKHLTEKEFEKHFQQLAGL